MVKWLRVKIPQTQGFSPLLILFMVKSTSTTQNTFASFSPLLILFMVKLLSLSIVYHYSFSPLLILFMVKWVFS